MVQKSQLSQDTLWPLPVARMVNCGQEQMAMAFGEVLTEERLGSKMLNTERNVAIVRSACM